MIQTIKIKFGLFTAGLCLAVTLNAQTFYIPSGTSGIGTSTNGNVGIGTSSPLSILSVEANNWVVNGESKLISSQVSGTELGQIYTYAENIGGYSGIGFKTLRGGLDGLATRMYINSLGNVGISTTTPRTFLDIGNFTVNTLKSVLARLGEGDNTGEGTYLGVKSYNSQPELGASCCNIKSFALEHKFYGNLNSAINFYRGSGVTGGYITISVNAGIEKFTFSNNGLDVNGTIHAKEVKVDLTGWSDFVFAPTFKLKPLTEVEQYIKTNGHLPEIPSATEVEQKGVNLGVMQAKLLQKVEELTLYTIEQNKTKDDLKVKIEAQSKQLLEQEQSKENLQQQLALQANEIEKLKLLITQKLK